MSGKAPIIFRCDVSPAIGIGHLMRSRTFAAVLRQLGQRCIMLGPPDDYRTPVDAELFDTGLRCLSGNRARATRRASSRAAREHGARRAVLDDYRVDLPFQDVLHGEGMIWMQHFDASKEHWFRADMIVHGSPSETAERWGPYLLNPDAEMLFGPRYAVLRPEFPPPALRPDAARRRDDPGFVRRWQ